MEDHSAQSIASALPHQLVELFVRAYPDSFSCLHTLGRDRTSAGPVPLFVSGNARSVGIESSSRNDASARRRVFYLGGWICQCCSGFGAFGTDSATVTPTGRERCCYGPRRKAGFGISCSSRFY